ncbi:MAG: hypothetical protein HY369_03645 [Candidatus Aenigmarchaeota archaeon]|nr:hypothetical protein [Candidatus Aenigmarchaeota archaeon]
MTSRRSSAGRRHVDEASATRGGSSRQEGAAVSYWPVARASRTSACAAVSGWRVAKDHRDAVPAGRDRPGRWGPPKRPLGLGSRRTAGIVREGTAASRCGHGASCGDARPRLGSAARQSLVTALLLAAGPVGGARNCAAGRRARAARCLGSTGGTHER